ncbi:hypothetical protein BD311DRAFT_868472 [Dichomitus squalens]|uniref:Uncharacterized protein n=1 Tax=Dichomitus squalens TaxID=114155 RepID=A0A4Q9MCA1_9APHY|nr:hypothetical protein BD311DRAFT_868472 [Dichomitus squalens]
MPASGDPSSVEKLSTNREDGSYVTCTWSAGGSSGHACLVPACAKSKPKPKAGEAGKVWRKQRQVPPKADVRGRLQETLATAPSSCSATSASEGGGRGELLCVLSGLLAFQVHPSSESFVIGGWRAGKLLRERSGTRHGASACPDSGRRNLQRAEEVLSVRRQRAQQHKLGREPEQTEHGLIEARLWTSSIGTALSTFVRGTPYTRTKSVAVRKELSPAGLLAFDTNAGLEH